VDSIFIEKLEVDAIIGIHPWERRVRQTLEVDVEMAADAAAAGEDIANTVDYRAVAERIAEFIREGRFQLLETLCQELAETLRREFGPAWLKLSVSKPGAIARARTAGVSVERGRR